jgi:hypothetical protein
MTIAEEAKLDFLFLRVKSYRQSDNIRTLLYF